MSGITEEWIAALTLQNMEGVGPVIGRRLLEHFGSFAEIFHRAERDLPGLNGIPQNVLKALSHRVGFDEAEREILDLEKMNVQTFVITDQRFPRRLKQCPDSPLVLFSKGNTDLNYKRILAIVGSRKSSTYGEDQCRAIIRGLMGSNVMILSGLAYGIDIIAHRMALDCQLPTIAALAHGMDRVYPGAHSGTARKMLKEGGALISEFPLKTQPDRENFPKRNRIIAGMSDATLVIESGLKGGSMITASLAFDYNREVLALPANVGGENCRGPHDLIKRQKASLIESAEDILEHMSWTCDEKQDRQLPLLLDWTAEERSIAELLSSGDVHVDLLAEKSGTPRSDLATLLLQMEMKGMIMSVPGMRYKLA